VRVEVQDLEGRPVPGYAMSDCWPVIGDELDRVVRWRDGDEVSALAGRPVRLRFELVDADLYAMQFLPARQLPLPEDVILP
jgi:hypothetical protein